MRQAAKPASSTNTTASSQSSQNQGNKPPSSNMQSRTTGTTKDNKGMPKEFREQFLKKLQFCSNQYDFNDENKHQKEKNERLQYL